MNYDNITPTGDRPIRSKPDDQIFLTIWPINRKPDDRIKMLPICSWILPKCSQNVYYNFLFLVSMSICVLSPSLSVFVLSQSLSVCLSTFVSVGPSFFYFFLSCFLIFISTSSVQHWQWFFTLQSSDECNKRFFVHLCLCICFVFFHFCVFC